MRQSSSPAHFAGAAHSLCGCQPCRRGGEALSNTVPLRGSMCCTAVVEACRIQFMDRPQAPKTDSVSPPSNQGPLTGEEEQRPERNPLLDTTGPTRKGYCKSQVAGKVRGLSVFESCDVLTSADAHVVGPRHSFPRDLMSYSFAATRVVLPPYPQMSGSIHRRAVCTPLAGCGAMCTLGILLANMPRASGQMTVGQCANVPTGEPLRQSSRPAHFAGAAHSLYGCQPCRRGGEAHSSGRREQRL